MRPLRRRRRAPSYHGRRRISDPPIRPSRCEFTEDGLKTIIEYYTREAGVRNLEREIGSICRKVARKLVQTRADNGTNNDEDTFQFVANTASVKQLLGTTKFRPQTIGERSEIGLVNGLAVTEVGGDVLHVEATLVEGTGKLTLTGKLGDVMQESAQAAITYIRSRAASLGIANDAFKNYDLHIHVPEGAIPKDGPSAGITMATAIASVLTHIPVHRDVAMTGEVTLRGKVLPIGGLKEKLLAAHRAGMRRIVIPKDNEKDLADVPQDVLQELQIHLAYDMEDVLPVVLERPPMRATPIETSALTPPVWQTPIAIVTGTEGVVAN